MGQRGFGIAAAIDPDFIEPLAIAVEEAGYTTFWTNDTPGADGLAVLGRAARVTSKIRLGVGVVPLDRRSPQEIVAAIAESRIPADRLMLGIGSGGTHTGSLDLVRDGLHQLRELTSCSVAIGALGPRMIALAGESDAVLLNWLTPQWIESSTESLRETKGTELIGYVRTALLEGEAVLRREADRYSSVPAYGRHFERMGVSAFGTCACGDEGVIQAKLAEFDALLDETVVRAIVGASSLDANLALLRAAAPG